jgi:hypothetical protein
LHLTTSQRTILTNAKITGIISADGMALASSEANYDSTVITNAFKYFPVIDTGYTPTKIKYKLGFDVSKVLTPSSVIDGGTY